MNASYQLLVDGNNLLFKARDQLFAQAAGRGQLCSVLGAWAKRSGVPVLVIFDGEPPTRGVQQQFQASGVEIQFSRNRSADLVIEEIIETSRSPTLLRVISSDKAIQSAARHRRCSCTSSEAFVAELMDDGDEDRTAEVNTERNHELTDDEIAEWMEDFGFDPQVPPVEDKDLMGPVEPLD